MSWTARLLASATAAFLGGAELVAAETSNFNNPSLHGIRIDFCRHFGSDCGKPAADLFCREKGFAEAARFAIDENVGGRGIQTLVFGDGRTCDGQGCSGFRTITCTRPDQQQAAPAAPPPAIALAPAAPPPATTMVAPVQPTPAPTLRVKPVKPAEPPPPVIALPPPTPSAPPPTIAVLPNPPEMPAPPVITLRPAPPPPVVLATPPVLPPLPPKKPETLAAIPKMPNPTGPTPPASAPFGGGPIIAMPAGASLIRCTSGTCEFAVTHDFDLDPRDADQTEKFIGNVEKLAMAKAFRWQVTTEAFPPFQSGSDLAPPGLVGSGDLDGQKVAFHVDFKTLVGTLPGRGSGPENFYIRILPLAQAGSDIIVGQPSNVMRVYYATEPPPQEPIVIYDTSPPKLFTVKVVSFTPPIFEDPNRWGCITVTGYKEPILPAIKSVFPIGEKCPKVFKGGGYQITSFSEFVDWAAGGATGALDWVSDKHDDLKQLAVDVVMKYTPFGQQCEMIGKMIDDDAPGYCEVAAHVAVNAGLAALGMPPSIPNYNELIDKGVDHAVELAAAEIYAQTGAPCIELCEDALRDAFGKAAEELKKASYTPGCVGENEAHQHGREPLCVPAQVIAKPAPGAVYSPPVAEVEITRNFTDKDPMNKFAGTCHAGVGIRFDNQFSGGTVWGPPYSNKTMEVPAQPITGYLYQGEQVEIAEAMEKGSKKTLTFIFKAPAKFLSPWTKQLWQQSQIPPKDFMGGDWYALYWGGVAMVGANVNCALDGHTLAYQLPAMQ
jgi:hypothetical protein